MDTSSEESEPFQSSGSEYFPSDPDQPSTSRGTRLVNLLRPGEQITQTKDASIQKKRKKKTKIRSKVG